MINDGTALVLYRIAVGVATGTAFSLGSAALEFVGVSLGGIAVGLAVGFVSDLVIRRQSDSGLSIFLTVLTAYGAYVGAEELHVSGILAAVVAGVYGGYRSPVSLAADIRLNGVAFWSVLTFGLEISLFVLLGLQLPSVVDTLNSSGSGVTDLLWPVIAIAVASILMRLAFVFAMRGDTGESFGERFAVGWSGMRGAVSLAAALAVPLDVPGPAADHLPHLRADPRHPGRPGPLAAVHHQGAAARGDAALVRRRGGGADGGGAGGARPARRDGGRGARFGHAAEAPAGSLSRAIPDVPGGARRRRSRRRRRGNSGSSTTGS